MLKVAGVRQTLAELKAAKLKLELTATQRYKNLVEVIFIDLVSHTPQFSGNLAANWKVVVGGSGTASYLQVFNSIKMKGEKDDSREEAREAGDEEAIDIAISMAEDQIARIKYNSVVSIVNPTQYSEEVDAGYGPTSKNPIRTENKYRGPYVPKHGVAMAAYVEMKYENLRYKKLAYEGKYFDNLTKSKW